MAEQISPIPRIEVYDDTIYNLQGAMGVSTKVQAIIAHNLANASTPGYRALKFDEVLNKVVERTENPSVNLEEEMAALSDNSIRYSSYIKLLSSKINILKSIVTQGKK